MTFSKSLKACEKDFLSVLEIYNELITSKTIKSVGFNKSQSKGSTSVLSEKEAIEGLNPSYLENAASSLVKKITENNNEVDNDETIKILEEQVKDLNYLHSLIVKKTTIELIPKLKEVILQRVILLNNKSYIFITGFTEDNPVLFKINEQENNLQKATYVELENVYNLIKEKVFKLNEIIGFSSLFKEEKNVAFKIKYTTKKRDTGSRCDQKGKKLILQIIDDILQNKTYSEKNNDKIKGKELCTDQELILRYFDKEKKQGLRWYFNLEEYYFTK